MIVSEKEFDINFHGGSRQVEVKGRHDVGVEDAQSTNQIAAYVYLRTTAGEKGGI